MAPWKLYEACCGSAALTLHLLGAKRAPVPYQGNKWRLRRELAAVAAEMGFEGPPEAVKLTDPGPWGDVAPLLLAAHRRGRVLEYLRRMADDDPRDVYDALHGQYAAHWPEEFAAEFLFLQRLAFSGKAVGLGGRDGARGGEVWKSPGFCASDAYGKPASDTFGAVSPMVPSMIRAIEAYDDLRVVQVMGGRMRAHGPVGWRSGGAGWLVYIDPPYARASGYPNGTLGRQEVVDLALAWHQAGAGVMVSEGEAIGALVERGWTARRLGRGRPGDKSPFKGKQEEWVTFKAPAAGPSAT